MRRLDERGEIDGLSHEAVGPEIVAADHVLLLVARREDDDREPPCSVVGAHPPEHAETVNPRQLQIEEHDGGHERAVSVRVGARGEQVLERFCSVTGDDNLVDNVASFKGPQRELDVIGIVFDQQDDPVASQSPPPDLTGGIVK